MLIDTGSTFSFIRPELAQSQYVKDLQDPIAIKTITQSHKISKEAYLPTFKELGGIGKMRMLLFRFHQFFEGLIGIDLLQQLKAVIDIENGWFRTVDKRLQIQFATYRPSEVHRIEAGTKRVISIPVQVPDGDFLLSKTTVKEDMIISEGIYRAMAGESLVEVTNYAEIDQELFLEEPLKVVKFKTEQHFELNNIEGTGNEDTIVPFHKIRTEHLNSEELRELRRICKKYPKVFHKEKEKLSFTNAVKHQIRTGDDIPVYARPYRYAFKERQEVKKQIEKLLDQKIIRHSHSPWSAPVWLVPKKKDASGERKWRMVVDYRKLNEKVIKDRYPMPIISDVLDSLGRAKYFSTLDLASGYHQIEVKAEDIPKTAFSAEGGHFEYVRMPFGLNNAPATFQRLMNNIFGELLGKCCLIYMDDIMVFSASLQEHITDLERVFKKLAEANFKLQLDKTEFLRKEVEYLGHVVTQQGIKPNPGKIEAIKRFEIPKTRKQIKSFLGLLGYYRKFIRDFAAITKPMTKQLKGKKTVQMDQEYKEAFEVCKTLLCNDPILQFPDFEKPFILTTDASNYAIGAVLSQGNLGTDRPIAYASRTLSGSEVNYATIEKEMLAIIWAIKHFRHYVFGTSSK